MLVRIKPTSITETFISEEPIGQLAAVYFSTGGQSVKEGTSDTQQLVAGVSIEGALSGKACRVVTHGV
ncbi:MAG: hypothetical protein Q7T57_02760, partial [Dehalococcoidales bacterium]|nr:hypothetical protein [Dehalococcoidales bacterium]